jgi:hypothetical protein
VIQEEMVCICEPEVGENLSDEEKRSMEDLMNFQEGSDEDSYFQVGNEMRSVDLIDCQEGRSEIPDCKVGKGDEVRLLKSQELRGEFISTRCADRGGSKEHSDHWGN